MTESKAERPKLRIIKGKRRKFEPPIDVTVPTVPEANKDKLLKALESDILARPVREGTDEIPSLEEYARAKELAEELDADSSEANTPENHK